MNWKKISIISLVCVIFDMGMHMLWAPIYSYTPPSYFITHNLFKPAAAVLLFVTFFLFGIVFAYMQNDLSGKKLAKGMRFGAAFAILWFIAMPGTSLIFNSPFWGEAVSGACDALSILLLGLFLGKYIAKDSESDKKSNGANIIVPVFIIAIIFFTGRYLAYRIFNIELAYAAKLHSTLAWTSLMGLSFGLLYGLLKGAVAKFSPAKKAIIFGGLILGIDWLLFNFFALLFVAISPWELLLQAATDILLVMCGIYTYEKLIKRSGHICPAEFAGVLDIGIRKLVHNPKKILKDYVKEGMTALDIGCGPGFFTLEMARMTGESGKVIAADLQAGMLKKMKNKIKGGELEKRIILHQTTEDKIGISEKVDFVLIFYMLHETSDQKNFLEELKLILRPGGKILLVEPKFHVSKKMFKKFVNFAVELGFQQVARPKIFFSRAVVLNKNSDNNR